MAAKGKHREPIIDAAIRHFRQQGYPGTGINDIVASSGAPKGSVYHYFPGGKPEIAVAAVEEAGRRMAGTMREIAAECDGAGAFIVAFAQVLGSWLKQSGYRDGCPMTTVMLELSPQDRSISKAGRAAYNARFEVLEAVLQQSGVRSDTSVELAVLWMSALNGALIQARVFKSTGPLESVSKLLADMVPSFAASKGRRS